MSYVVVKDGNNQTTFSVNQSHDTRPYIVLERVNNINLSDEQSTHKEYIVEDTSTYRFINTVTTNTTASTTTGYKGYSTKYVDGYRASGYRRTTTTNSTWYGNTEIASSSMFQTYTSTDWSSNIYDSRTLSEEFTATRWWDNTQSTNYYDHETRAYTKNYDHLNTFTYGAQKTGYSMKGRTTYSTTKQTSSSATWRKSILIVEGGWTTSSNSNTYYHERENGFFTKSSITFLSSSETLTQAYATTDYTPYYNDFTSTSRRYTYSTQYDTYTSVNSSNMYTSGGYNTTALTQQTNIITTKED